MNEVNVQGETKGESYWCSVCSAVHTQKQGSDEYVTKTGWVIVKNGVIDSSGQKVNIGFCNGEHSKGRPVHMMPAGIMPEFTPIGAADGVVINIETAVRS